MAEVTCKSCGHVEESSENWMQCPECGYTMCPRCGLQQEKERQNLEKLRKGGAYERLSATCPSCNYGMIHL